MALVLTKLSHQWLRDWWWASVRCGRHLARSRLLISRLKPHRGKGSSGAPVAASNFASFFLWALRYVLNIRIHKIELQITENNAMFEMWKIVDSSTSSRSLRFHRFVYWCVFARCVFIGCVFAVVFCSVVFSFVTFSPAFVSSPDSRGLGASAAPDSRGLGASAVRIYVD